MAPFHRYPKPSCLQNVEESWKKLIVTREGLDRLALSNTLRILLPDCRRRTGIQGIASPLVHIAGSSDGFHRIFCAWIYKSSIHSAIVSERGASLVAVKPLDEFVDERMRALGKPSGNRGAVTARGREL